MSHVARVEVPGMFHLVEQRVRCDLRVPMETFDRCLCLALFCGCVRMHGMQLCGYSILSDRVLLVVVPERPDSISPVLLDADRTFVKWFNRLHHRVAPFWQGTYNCCPFADELAWSVLRYVDMASVRAGDAGPLEPHRLNSAAAHAGLPEGGPLTAPAERLPPHEGWLDWLALPEDRGFLLALEQCLRTGKPFGPLQFVRKVERACGRRLRPACLGWPGLFDGHR